MDRSEAHRGLLKFVTDYLWLQHGWVYKVWGGPFSRPGVPDILACVGGRLVAVEAKTGKAVLDADQQYERERLERAGALYVLCRRPEDLERALVAAGLVQPALLAFGE